MGKVAGINLKNPKITKEDCIEELINLDKQISRLAKEEITINVFLDSFFPHAIDETLIVLEHGEITEMKIIPVGKMVDEIKEKYKKIIKEK